MKPELNLPNIITASRILLTPAFVLLMLSGDGLYVQLSAAVFLLAAISDWYDGWYARKFNAMSAFGRFFDPLADKVLVGAGLFAFAGLGMLPWWMVAIVVGRDVLVTVLRIIADRRQSPVVTSRLAKWKTAMQLVFLWYIVGSLTLTKIEWLQEHISLSSLNDLFSPWIITSSMAVLTILSLVTAVQYLVENRHLIRIVANDTVARTPS